MSKTKLEQLKQVHEIQGYKGNWDYSEYMLGLYNGLELALAIYEEREPNYKNPPKRFGCEPSEESVLDKLREKLRKGWLR